MRFFDFIVFAGVNIAHENADGIGVWDCWITFCLL